MARIDLSGPNGNAFALMGMARSWARQLDRDPAPILAEMMAGDYNNLLDVVDREFHGVIEWENDPRDES